MSRGRVLVTGGAGYIGSHAAKALHRAGYAVVVFDNLSAGHREAVKYDDLVEGDVTDVAAARAAPRHGGNALRRAARRRRIGPRSRALLSDQRDWGAERPRSDGGRARERVRV